MSSPSGTSAGAAYKIVLYGPAQTPFTEKVRRGLELKQLAYELREPSGPEDYKRWSPKTGLLPVLSIDGESDRGFDRDPAAPRRAVPAARRCSPRSRRSPCSSASSRTGPTSPSSSIS